MTLLAELEGYPPSGIEVVNDTSPTLGGHLDADGYDINDSGVLFQREQATAEADIAGQGQYWTKNDTPNVPMFTDDAGNDRALCWVESGTFTPTIQDDSLSNSESQTYTTQTGAYRRIGDVVFYWISVTINSLGTLNTAQGVRVAGLPYTVSTRSALSCSYGTSLAIAAGEAIGGYANFNTTHLVITKWDDITGATALLISELSSGGNLVISGMYVV